MAYGKLFESLYTGSMVGAGPEVFAVWAYCIANSKPPGVVEINPVLLGAAIGMKPEEVEAVLEKLCEPDPKSRSKEDEGRRLVREGEFLFRMPTWPKYNELRNEAARREANRRHQADYRARQKAKANKGNVSAEPLTRKDASAESAHGDVEGEERPETETSIDRSMEAPVSEQKGEGAPSSTPAPAEPEPNTEPKPELPPKPAPEQQDSNLAAIEETLRRARAGNAAAPRT